MSTTTKTASPILFVSDLAELLGRTHSAVRKALAEGRLGRYGTLDGRKFVFRDAFLEYLRGLEIDPNRAPTRGDACQAPAGSK